MPLIDLPTEMVYHLLDFLDAPEILFSFRLVCRRFYSIVENYDRVRIELDPRTSRNSSQRLCRIVQPSSVISLILSKSYFNPEPIDRFVRSASIDEFHRLRSLVMWDVGEENLRLLISPLVRVSMLSAVTLGTSYIEEWSNKTTINLLISSLIALGSLRQLTLDIDGRDIDAILWPDHSTIEELTLRCCSYRQFCWIIDRSPNLRAFVLNDSWMRDIIPSIRPTTSGRSLTSLTLKKIDIPMIDLEFFLSLQPGLISLTMTTKNDVSWQTFRHLIQWETFLRSTLPHLQKLSLSLSNKSSRFKNVESILLPLSTAFWLEEKRWFFTCQYTESSSFKQVQLSPVTSSAVSFPDYLHHANISYAITSMRANQSTRMCTARVDLTRLINTIIENKVR